MPTQYFYPKDEGAQLLWFKNLSLKFGGYSSPLDISTGEATATGNDLNYLIWTWEYWIPVWRTYAESATAFRRTVATGTGPGPLVPPALPNFTGPAGEPAAVDPGALTRLLASIGRWKTAPGYTADIGQDLQIIGPEMPAGPTAPEVKGKVVGGLPQLTFVKAGHKGVYIESRRDSEPVFAFLTIDTEKPYVDTRPLAVAGQPEWREYRMKFWEGAPGMPEGEWSEIIRLTAGE